MTAKSGGFTLIELLIAMVLMVILLAATAFVFAQTTEAVNVSEARVKVYDQARKAIDFLQTDLMGCLPLDSSQRLVLEDGAVGGGSGWSRHVGRAKDRISFDTLTSAGDAVQRLRVTYELQPYVDAANGYGNRTGRPLFVLVRRLRTVEGAAAVDSLGTAVPDQELCHYVLSFNVEYLANTGRFSQLEPSPCPPSDPLGDGAGSNDGPTSPLRIPYLRIVLTVVDGSGERQERTFPRVVWIPAG
jgi:prepilin-type N-terminal cleavage/methylation domain-containing protein